MKLRRQSLIAILEDNGFLRKSFQGFLNDYSDAKKIFDELSKEVEDYDSLSAMQHPERVDDLYLIWLRPQGPVFITEKLHYDEDECKFIAHLTDIPLEVFQEVAEATK